MKPACPLPFCTLHATTALWLCGLALLLAAPAFAQEKKAAAKTSSLPGLRMFTCAHSFHGFVYGLVADMAADAGIKHEAVGISSIGGSRVTAHWEVAEEKNLAKAALKAGKVDVLTLSPIWLPDEGIEKLARLGLEHNPNLRITVQEYWLPNDEYVPVYPLQTRKKVDHNATNLEELKKANALYAKDIEAHVSELNKSFGKDAILIVPVGVASIALREKIVAGQAPGLKAQWDLFTDTWGHAQMPLRVLSAYCHYAVIYRRNPAGLPMPRQFVAMKGFSEEDKVKLNQLLQELAWQAVTQHPMTGVTAETAANANAK